MDVRSPPSWHALMVSCERATARLARSHARSSAALQGVPDARRGLDVAAAWTNLSSAHRHPPRARSATKAATSEPSGLLPLPDRLSSATAGRPRGCSPRSAATLSSPEPRVWNVAVGLVRFSSTEILKALVGEMRSFRALRVRRPGERGSRRGARAGSWRVDDQSFSRRVERQRLIGSGAVAADRRATALRRGSRWPRRGARQPGPVVPAHSILRNDARSRPRPTPVAPLPGPHQHHRCCSSRRGR